ncbi:hypothetical protein BJX68DRAFT_267232 [Aspergillus pseudodeflectus]|uniref:Actin-like ATPase domain-containing protein n=1 Tax=Aspergillus pseudodeflectus TaxID=176178 RepID=A0ABR4KAS2_9EURO
MNAAANSLTRPIIVGLDFGTSGTAFSYTKPVRTGPSRYGIVITPSPWPSGGSEQKVPTQIAYKDENSGHGGFGQEDFVWGFRVRPGMTMSSWFKLFLHMDPLCTPCSDGIMDEAVRMGILRLPPGKSGIDLTADFLKRILDTIHRVVSPHGDLASQPLVVWLTVPVTWSPAAVGALETAATRAGFGQRTIGKLELATEADTTIHHVVHSLGNRFEVNEGVLVCDVGGGTTVGLSTFRITGKGQRIQWTSLRDDQVGGRCAGAAVESNIYRLLTERFGRAFECLPVADKCPGSRFGRLVEEAKHKFGPGSTEPSPLPLRMDPTLLQNNAYYSNGLVYITKQDLQRCFDPVLQEIIELVELEIKITQMQYRGVKIDHLVFVGGMIESAYMRWMLEFKFGNSYRLAIPEHPRLAVTRGAALRGTVDGRTEQA